jgi:hypothetical protein
MNGVGDQQPEGQAGHPPAAWGAPAPKGPPPSSESSGPLPLRPMNLGDVLDGAIKLLLANWRTLVIVAGVFIVPLNLLSAFLQRELLGGVGILAMLSDPAAVEALAPSAGLGTNVGCAVQTLAGVLVLPFIAGAISKVVSASYLGGRLEAGAALRAAGGRWWSLIASWALVHLLQAAPWVVAIGVLTAGIVTEVLPLTILGVLLLLPAILGQMLIMALFVPVAPAIVVEGLGPIRAMRRSARLVRPRVWPVLLAAIVSGLVAGLLTMVLSGLPSFVAMFVGLRYGWIVVALGGIVAGLLTMPFVANVATLLYYDARIRHEGFDLQVLAAGLDARPRGRPQVAG